MHRGPNVVSHDVYQKYQWISQSYPILGSGEWLWCKYSEEQLIALDELVAELLEKYPSIEYIVSHEEIDKRGWKTDPGPAFPMKRYRAMLDERTPVFEQKAYVVSSDDNLNVRVHPRMGTNIVAELEPGRQVHVTEFSGTWAGIKWWVNGEANTGWVYGKYITELGPVEDIPVIEESEDRLIEEPRVLLSKEDIARMRLADEIKKLNELHSTEPVRENKQNAYVTVKWEDRDG
mgnify:CR=1 FL=1